MVDYAVLTGDIVKSSKLTSEHLDAVRQRLQECVRELNQWQRGKLFKGNIDFYRGDGWQALLIEPKYSLRAAIFLRASLMAYEKADSRIAIGIGAVTKINEKQISQSTGEAFALSGGALDGLKRRHRMTIATAEAQKNQSLRPIFYLCDALAQKWSLRQAESVRWALLERNQSDIAEELSVRQQAVGKFLNGAGWYALDPILIQLEKPDNTTL